MKIQKLENIFKVQLAAVTPTRDRWPPAELVLGIRLAIQPFVLMLDFRSMHDA